MPSAVAASPSPSPRRSTRGRPPTPGLREDIVRAAAAVFGRRDFHDVQMDDVARACGVGKGTLYRYFPSKRALYLAVAFEGISRLREEVASAAAADAPAERRLARIVHVTLAHFWDRRQFFALIHQHEHRPDDADVQAWQRERTRLVAVVRGVVAAGIRDGSVRAVDAHVATELLFGMMRAVTRYRDAGDTVAAAAQVVVDTFLHGVGARA